MISLGSGAGSMISFGSVSGGLISLGSGLGSSVLTGSAGSGLCEEQPAMKMNTIVEIKKAQNHLAILLLSYK
jgi:hypothetical protein